MKITFENQPFTLGEPQYVSGDMGYKLNIFEPVKAGSVLKGSRVCQIPNFSWRSKQAVLDLGNRLAALPVLEEALKLIANADEPRDLVALGMRAYAREALAIAGLWNHGGEA